MSTTNESNLEEMVKSTLAQLSTQEMIDCLSGETSFYRGSSVMLSPNGYASRPWIAARKEKLGLPGVKFVDGPRGIILKGGTTFPVPSGRAASFDGELEERIGEAIGKELVSLGGNTFGGVCVNLLRHPAWGRAQESYGEDPLVLGEMGSSLVRGVEKYASSVVKHFALNSMENARFFVDVKTDERTLHEIYLRHFKRIVTEANCSFIMSSYNQVNGHYAGEHDYLLNQTLKKRWGFKGAVMTDFVFGLRDARKSILAGQDLEMPFRQTFDAKLSDLVTQGEVPLDRIQDAVSRLIRVQKRPRLRVTGFSKEEHRTLALQSAQESIVMLQNADQLLPLAQHKKIALFGELAKMPNTGDHGSSRTQPEHVVTVEEGIIAEFGQQNVTYHDGLDVDSAVGIARESDVAVVVVGYTYKDEGEFIIPKPRPQEMALFPRPKLRDIFPIAKMVLLRIKDASFGPSENTVSFGGDRTSLELRPEDQKLIEMVSSTNPNTIVIVMSGSSFICESWRDKVKSILCVWYPGEQGGTAIARVIRGKVNPGGKLPMVFVKHAEHLPFFDRNAQTIDYEFWHGYRKLEKEHIEPAFPFGFGLSFTTFELSSARVEVVSSVPQDELSNSALKCLVTVGNTGSVVGDEVVQVYLSAVDSRVDPRPIKELIGFKRVKNIQPGEKREIELSISWERLAYYDTVKQEFEVERCMYHVIFARHSLDVEALFVPVDLRT